MMLTVTFMVKQKVILNWDYMRGAWQKNNGLRIDHFLVSNSLLNLVKNVNINKDPRGKEKPSDHTPIEIELT